MQLLDCQLDKRTDGRQKSKRRDEVLNTQLAARAALHKFESHVVAMSFLFVADKDRLVVRQEAKCSDHFTK